MNGDRGVDGRVLRGGGGREQKEKRKGKLWFGCKRNEKINHNNKKDSSYSDAQNPIILIEEQNKEQFTFLSMCLQLLCNEFLHILTGVVTSSCSTLSPLKRTLFLICPSYSTDC